MDAYLDNLASAATQEKDALQQLVANNTSLVKQLGILSEKHKQSSNKDTTSSSNDAPMTNGQKM